MSTRDRAAILARRLWPLFGLIVLVVVVTVLGSLGSGSLNDTVVTGLVYLLLVISLYTFAGNAGVFSFGHLSFMAIGGYTAAILTIPVEQKKLLLPGLPGMLATAHMGSVAAVLVAGMIAAIFGAIVAIPLVRLTGLVATLGTFAVLLIVNVVAKNWNDVTNGLRGISSIPITTSTSRALLFAVGAIIVAFAFQESPIGRRLRASRADEEAARSIGISIVRERGVALVVSAFIGGMAGALYAQMLGSIGPDSFFLNLTFLTIAMLVVGGITNLSGAVVGTIVVSVVSELLRRLEDGVTIGPISVDAPAGLANLGLGVVMLLILIFLPLGITRGREFRWPLGSWEDEWRRRVLRQDTTSEDKT